MATLFLTSATNDSTNLVIAQGIAKFGFNLTGSDEVPFRSIQMQLEKPIFPHTTWQGIPYHIV